MDKMTQDLLADLRQKHGEVEATRLENGAIVAMRKPKLDEFLDAAEPLAQQEAGRVFRDPGIVTRPLLALLCHGLDEAKAELDISPAFDLDLASMMKRLAGNRSDIDLDEAPDAVTPEIKAVTPRAIAYRCDGFTVVLRPLDRFDWTRFQGEAAAARNGLPPSWYSPRVLAKFAALQVIEAPDAAGRKANFEALADRWPMVVPILGMTLGGTASSKAQRIEGK